MSMKPSYRPEIRDIRLLHDEILDGVHFDQEYHQNLYSEYPGYFDISAQAAIEELTPNNLTMLNNLKMDFNGIYAYAFSGIPDRILDNEGLFSFERALIFVNGPGNAAELVRATNHLLCPLTLATAIVRFKLDWDMGNKLNVLWYEHFSAFFSDAESDNFTLREISLLAQMNEKSVRNATHSTKPVEERLMTTKLGGKSIVTHEAAITWLSKRRGFVPTQLHDEKG